MQVLRTVSPIDGRVVVERPLADRAAVEAAVARARRAFPAWRARPVAERVALLHRAIDHMVSKREEIAREITLQMGRPIAHAPGEVRGLEERARCMLALALEALGEVRVPEKPGFTRFMRREPLGLVLVVAPWNYPYLTAVNAIVPALAAGNCVILKHSHQTPLCAERFQEAMDAAGLPEGVFQHLHMDHPLTAALLAEGRVDHAVFTGSVAGGHAMQRAAGESFCGLALELGGKDPAYVRADADLAHAVENLVDGACFNAGQSCCGIERIYVHEKLYDDFVQGYVELASRYVLDDPLLPTTTLGPMVRAQAADFARAQVAEAVAAGAKALIDPKRFPREAPGSPYMAPQCLVDVDHTMRVMREESFAPIVGIRKVGSDEEAIALMNDSAYGLTAAVWTRDLEAAIRIGERLETGTVFMNRCDYLDPELAWVGVKDSGRGVALSKLAYEHLTRPKSFHLRHPG
ncbi:MAG: aldehyde dehydrogenase [Geminicoccaceae bacterium]|jgi:acyl-CoA reductase-like NAD-dependent aldehyde dehydrogenase|nr:MAG: aldehyde dehydrogenase [Geminicoccaceae bacterium]